MFQVSIHESQLAVVILLRSVSHILSSKQSVDRIYTNDQHSSNFSKFEPIYPTIHRMSRFCQTHLEQTFPSKVEYRAPSHPAGGGLTISVPTVLLRQMLNNARCPEHRKGREVVRSAYALNIDRSTSCTASSVHRYFVLQVKYIFPSRFKAIYPVAIDSQWSVSFPLQASTKRQP